MRIPQAKTVFPKNRKQVLKHQNHKSTYPLTSSYLNHFYRKLKKSIINAVFVEHKSEVKKVSHRHATLFSHESEIEKILFNNFLRIIQPSKLAIQFSTDFLTPLHTNTLETGSEQQLALELITHSVCECVDYLTWFYFYCPYANGN